MMCLNGYLSVWNCYALNSSFENSRANVSVTLFTIKDVLKFVIFSTFVVKLFEMIELGTLIIFSNKSDIDSFPCKLRLRRGV